MSAPASSGHAGLDVARQRRRLFIAMTVTTVCVIVALAAVIGSFAFHIGWMMWVFVAAILAGFASHGWLMLGVMRDRSGAG